MKIKVTWILNFYWWVLFYQFKHWGAEKNKNTCLIWKYEKKIYQNISNRLQAVPDLGVSIVVS